MESRSESLPIGVKLTGWIFLFVGVWNCVLGAAALSSTSETGLLAVPGIRQSMMVFCVWAAFAVVASIGLLLRKEWGRKVTVLMVYLLMLCIVGWTVFCVAKLMTQSRENAFDLVFRIVSTVVSAGFLCVILFGLYALTRYLGKERVRAAF